MINIVWNGHLLAVELQSRVLKSTVERMNAISSAKPEATLRKLPPGTVLSGKWGLQWTM